ncbi:MAG: YifB family Mg chelatase-like AAA ATPase [Deltaproteobacteria bacterium]|nr:YifB family Mg chelatase-like AAA ATPase [Deltaproteobacteria bacterium]
MALAKLLSAGLLGIEAYPVHVEVDLSYAVMPKWSTVGLAENAVRESKDRVIAALQNTGYPLPPRRITLNLAPADIKKSGTAFDLPIALGLLAAQGILKAESLKGRYFLGELSLNGQLRPVGGLLSVALMVRKQKSQELIIPQENLLETQELKGVRVLGAQDLPSVVEYLNQNKDLKTPQGLPTQTLNTKASYHPDFSQVRGQAHAKRALEIAASGLHNILMVGPPGTGKSLLASCLPSILPPMNFEEQLGSSRIYSLLGLLPPGLGLLKERPFRSPHHNISDAGLIGGGSHPRPGEVSLAHHGVLFLDELPEFRKNVLEALRQPLESGHVTIARALQSLTYPARFLLAAAMNPCPCGQLGNPKVECRCTPHSIQRYQSKLSGPLLDRMDLQLEVPSLDYEEISQSQLSENSKCIRQRVMRAWEIQQKRFQGTGLQSNAQMRPAEIEKYCTLGQEEKQLIKKAMEQWKLSARAYHRILKVARTIADLKQSEKINKLHLSEALNYRYLDKKNHHQGLIY